MLMILDLKQLLDLVDDTPFNTLQSVYQFEVQVLRAFDVNGQFERC
jgi:hypothetical protein